MADSTVRVTGLKETIRAFGKAQPALRRELQKEMSDIARIVSEDARSWAGLQFGTRVAMQIRPRVRGSSAYVESRAPSKGLRPNYGGLLMRRVLIPAAYKNEGKVIDAMEDMLDRVTSEAGLGRGGLL